MKGSHLYLLCLFAFLVLVFIAKLLGPHVFEWKPTYDKYDKEPFGSYVFDDVLSSSIDNYTVINQTFYQLYHQDSTASGRAYLLTEEYIRLVDTDITYLFKIIESGNQVMLCTDDFSHLLLDTISFTVNYNYYTSFPLKGGLKEYVRDSIFFGADTLNPTHIYTVFPQMHPVALSAGMTQVEYQENTNEKEDSLPYIKIETWVPIRGDSLEVLVWNDNFQPLAMRIFFGKGELFLVSTPLMFTNFGILDGENASYVFRLLSFMKDKPLYRIEAYGSLSGESQIPLRYVLAETPLRWAIYSSLLLLLLFMFFTAKRRQRIIPVVTTPPNRTLGFIQLISNLYYQKHDNVEILKMKYMYFCADVKNGIGIELDEQVPGEADYERLMEKTGMEKDFISQLLRNIRLSIYREETSDLQLQQFIDGMNVLLRALKT